METLVFSQFLKVFKDLCVIQRSKYVRLCFSSIFSRIIWNFYTYPIVRYSKFSTSPYSIVMRNVSGYLCKLNVIQLTLRCSTDCSWSLWLSKRFCELLALTEEAIPYHAPVQNLSTRSFGIGYHPQKEVFRWMDLNIHHENIFKDFGQFIVLHTYV